MPSFVLLNQNTTVSMIQNLLGVDFNQLEASVFLVGCT